MGVNLTKEVKEAIEKSKQIASEEAEQADANAEDAAKAEAAKTDCDTLKKRNASKLTQVFQNFIT